jgi:hypothetical protein
VLTLFVCCLSADVDRNCEIDAAGMNVAMLKVLALSDIITQLYKQISPLDPWNAQAEDLPA